MRVRTNWRQGKETATANATGVDTSKTLFQARTGGTPVERVSAGAQSAHSDDFRVSDERIAHSEEVLLGRYRLHARLGAGGFGVVWRAHDELLDREVAVKRIPLPSEEDRERAKREALATARLSHPAIVALYEASADEDAFYLISELVEGDTLARLISDDELCDEEILEIGIALCEALEHAHARGVIHRDVKPHNVLVPDVEAGHPSIARGGPPAAAKLADFGGARMAGEDALTRTGDVLGTLAYMAPEQSEGHEVGTAADLYSLALVLYEALCGVNPVRGRTPAATARRIGTPIDQLARRRRDLPRELTRALDTALDPEAERRGTLEALHDALVHALEQGSKRGLLSRRRSHQGPEWEARDGGSSTLEPDELTAQWTKPPPASVAARVPLAPEVGDERDERHDAPSRRGPALPRTLWFGCVLAVAVWQALAGRVGLSLLLLAAGAPLLALPRRSGPGWLVAALAPVLGLAGLAAAFPALAGQRASWRARAGLAALGFWWLALCEPLLQRRLWLGEPSGVPPRAVWESSLGSTTTHVLAATFTLELLLGAALWALAAATLPWVVRGASATLDVLGAVAWTVALLLAMPLLDRALLMRSDPSPHGLVLGAALGCVLAVCARALRGPV